MKIYFERKQIFWIWFVVRPLATHQEASFRQAKNKCRSHDYDTHISAWKITSYFSLFLPMKFYICKDVFNTWTTICTLRSMFYQLNILFPMNVLWFISVLGARSRPFKIVFFPLAIIIDLKKKRLKWDKPQITDVKICVRHKSRWMNALNEIRTTISDV